MKAAKPAKPTAPQTNLRSAGAASLKSMLFALKAENARVYAANGDDGEMATPEQLAPILEAAVAEANGSSVVGFRGGFYAALAEWLAPTVDGCLATLDDWEPLAEMAPSGAAKSAPEPAEPVPVNRPGAAPLHVTIEQADKLFNSIATLAVTARDAAVAAGESAGETPSATSFYALQSILEQIGALADTATGGNVVGSLTDWVCGRHFNEDRQ